MISAQTILFAQRGFYIECSPSLAINKIEIRYIYIYIDKILQIDRSQWYSPDNNCYRDFQFSIES